MLWVDTSRKSLAQAGRTPFQPTEHVKMLLSANEVEIVKTHMLQDLTVHSKTDPTSIEFAAWSGFFLFERVHLKSLQFSPWSETSVTLKEDVLTHMVHAKIVGEQTKQPASTERQPPVLLVCLLQLR